mgnify:FL=1
MNKKYLPIKIFEKRKDYDDRSTEGGGDSHESSWVLHGEELNIHANYLNKSVRTVQASFKKWKEDQRTLPMIISTTVIDQAVAKTHRGRIVNLLENDGRDNVIGVFGDRQLLSMVTEESVLETICEALDKKEDEATLISSIADIEVFSPFVEPFEKENNVYRVRLCNYNDFDLNNHAKHLFEQACDAIGIKIDAKVRFTSDMTIYRVTVDSLEQLNAMGEFECVYSAEKTYPILASMDFLDTETTVAVKQPDEEEEYPVVGVLDTGIADISYLTPWKETEEHTNYPSEYQDNSHGTFVAGIIEYGDELNGTNVSSLNGVKLFNAVVHPGNTMPIYPEELIDNVREAVENNPEIKIWNLSLGTTMESELDEFSEFGMALDNIQDENNVLIIKSAGNCTNFAKGLPKSRISKTADSVRSLVVGSIAETQEEKDYAEPNMPSPFTRVGPGPASIVKPDLVYYGGNAGVENGKIVINGVPSFGLDGSVYRNVGTSFSTPRVSRIAAELAFMMHEDFDALLIKALMIHYAKYPADIKMKMTDKVAQMGFGMPVGAREILYNSPDEITLILRDTLEKGSFIEMFDFPYPTSLVDENGFFRGQIILTLVNKSLVDEKQAGEYCQSNIDVLFGTYETEKERDVTKPTIKNPRGVDVNQNLLADSLYSASAKGVHPITGFERECTLVKYGKKFHPVKKYAIDLADMTPSNRDKWLPSNRKWYLKIEGLYRDFIEKEAVKKDFQLSQEYCMILTIRDPERTAPVYDEVTQQLTMRNFVHHDVRVRNVVHVTNE